MRGRDDVEPAGRSPWRRGGEHEDLAVGVERAYLLRPEVGPAGEELRERARLALRRVAPEHRPVVEERDRSRQQALAQPLQGLAGRAVEVAVEEHHRHRAPRDPCRELGGERVTEEALDELGARPVHAVLGEVADDLLAAAGELAGEELLLLRGLVADRRESLEGVEAVLARGGQAQAVAAALGAEQREAAEDAELVVVAELAAGGMLPGALEGAPMASGAPALNVVKERFSTR